MLKEKTIAWDGHIIMQPSTSQIIIRIDDSILAKSQNTILLTEGVRSPVYYIPYSDVDPTYLIESDLLTHCKWKGEASYLTYVNGEEKTPNVAWKYPFAHTPVAPIRECVSFNLSLVSLEVHSR